MKQKHRGPTQIVQVKGKRQALSQVWEVQQSADTLDLFLYDEIAGDSQNWWTGEVTESETSADWFRQQLEAAPDVPVINLYVNSVGGDVLEAMGIRAHLLRHPAHKTAYVDGWAASAASFVLTGCDEIKMLTGSMQFLHNMWTLAIGNAKELRRQADEMDRMMVSNREMYLERAGGKLTDEQLSEMLDAETWLTAQQCVDYGLADSIIPAGEYKTIVQRAAVTPAAFQSLEDDNTPPSETQLEPDHPPASDTEQPEEIPATEEQPNQAAIFMAALLSAAERTTKHEKC